MMNLHMLIKKNYNIDSIKKIEKTKNGSGNTFLVETNSRKYILKINERRDFVKIYDKVEKKLNSFSLLQSRIIKTNKNEIMTTEGVVLYQHIEGENHSILNKIQSKNAIEYINKYNEALKLVPFEKNELCIKNQWDKARLMGYITNEFPILMTKLQLEKKCKKNINDVINILLINKAKLERQNKQLIHSDLGADNFIFQGNKVVSIIDFTPDYNHEVYSLCQFIYWNYLWSSSSINIEVINDYLRLYSSYSCRKSEDNVFYLLLLNSALYRIVGPLANMYDRGNKDYSRLEKRFLILEKLLQEVALYFV